MDRSYIGASIDSCIVNESQEIQTSRSTYYKLISQQKKHELEETQLSRRQCKRNHFAEAAKV